IASPNIFLSKKVHEKFVANDSETVTSINDFVLIKFSDANVGVPYSSTGLRVDVNIVDGDVLDKEAFKKWRPEYSEAEFILEEGKYLCGWEVEKMSKSKYNVV